MTLTWSVFLVILQLCGAWGAIDVVMKGRTAQGTVAWALALVLVPAVALPLYLFFGDRRFNGYVRARRHGIRQIDQAATELFEALKPHALPLGETHAAFTALGRLARLPFTGGNCVGLLWDGETTYCAMATAIDQSREYVLAQFYIIRADEVGQSLQEALLRARARGVRVMLLYDEIGSYALPGEYLARLRSAGCECSGFRTKPRKQQPFRINFRNHRKVVVVDGKVAFVGGYNIGREYLGLDAKLSPWRDTHLRVHGPAALCLQLVFLEDWYWANRRIPDLNWTPAAANGAGSRVLIVPNGPADLIEVGTLMNTMIFNAARRRLWLATPYFVPDEQIVGALQLAVLRGVDVRLLIPDISDHRMVYFSMLSYYEDLLPFGIRVYRYRPGFMHQKVTLSDNLAVVSTGNLDNRSLRINFEVSAVIADAAIADQVAAQFERDLSGSLELPKDAGERLTPWSRFLARTCRLFAPVQ